MTGTDTTPIPTGLEDLDTILEGGLRPGQLTVITGPTGIGKSTLALNILRHAAITLRRRAAMFTWEMPHTDIAMRILSAESRVLLTRIRTGKTMTDDDEERLTVATGRAKTAPYHVFDDTEPTTRAIGEAVGSLTRHPELVVVDYVQMLGDFVVAENLRLLKLLAMKTPSAVVAVGQFEPGTKNPWRDADIVMNIYRDDVRDKDSPRAGEADIRVRQRGGPAGVATVAAQLHYARFVSMAS